MKKVAILSMTVLFAVSVVIGQAQTTTKEQSKETKKEVKAERKALKKLEGTTVSVVAKNNFAKDFGTAKNPLWKRVDVFDEVAFSQDGKQMKAFYDENGMLVGTTQPKVLTDLPYKAQQDIKTKYNGYKIDGVILYDDNEINNSDMLLYGVQFDDSDNYFVEMTKGNERIVLQVTPGGYVSLFKKL